MRWEHTSARLQQSGSGGLTRRRCWRCRLVTKGVAIFSWRRGASGGAREPFSYFCLKEQAPQPSNHPTSTIVSLVSHNRCAIGLAKYPGKALKGASSLKSLFLGDWCERQSFLCEALDKKKEGAILSQHASEELPNIVRFFQSLFCFTDLLGHRTDCSSG